LPAVQQAREAARRTQCKNNLKQIALALHNYHDTHSVFPAGGYSSTPANMAAKYGDGSFQPQMSGAPWTVMILPFLEESAIYGSFNFSQPFAWSFDDSFNPGANSGVTAGNPNLPGQIRKMPKYLCPSYMYSEYPTLNYFGVGGGGPLPGGNGGNYPGANNTNRAHFNNGLVWRNSAVGIGQIIDGTTNTFMLGETIYSMVPPVCCETITWASGPRTNGGDVLDTTWAACVFRINSGDKPLPNASMWDEMNTTFSSFHTGGCHFGMADGSVQFVSENIDINIYRQAGTRNDGLPTGGLF
jgi:hypothetical protein